MHKRQHDSLQDAMIAATAQVHGLTVVTGNLRDFKNFDVPLLDQFQPA
jgi:predicted nucleic acid-binding protein